jgi:hypothetical protein
MNGKWARAYPPSLGRWGVIVWEAAGLAYLHWTTARLVDLRDDAGWMLAVIFALVWAAGSWQVVHMGLYLNAGAVRIRGIFRTRTVPWADIQTVTVEDIVYRAGPLRIPAGKTVILTLYHGDRLNTAMWQQGMDFHRRPQMFRTVQQDLRRRVADHAGRTAGSDS